MKAAVLVVMALGVLGCGEGCRRKTPEAHVSVSGSPDASADGARQAVAPTLEPSTTARPWKQHRWRVAGSRRGLVVLVYGGAGPSIFLEHARYRVYPAALVASGYEVVMPDYASAVAPYDDPVNVVRRTVASTADELGLPSSQIALVGFSRGAFISLSSAAQGIEVGAVVSFYGGLGAEARARVQRFPPTLVLHGERDDTVSVSEAHALETMLRARGVRYELQIYPDQDHTFRGAALEDSIVRLTRFLDRELRPTR